MHRRPAHLNRLFIALLVILFAAGAAARSQAEVVGEDARVRALIPGQNVSVGYLTLHNRGTEPVTVTAVTGDLSPRIEIHRVVRDGDMVRMRRQDALTLEAGASAQFKSGGLHLMLFDVEAVPETGELRFSTAAGDGFSVPYRRFAIGEKRP